MPKTNKSRDVEQGSSTPQKVKQDKSRMVTPTKDSKSKAVSPAKTEPMSPTKITIDIADRNSRSLGILGMTRAKSVMVTGSGLCLLGALAYFILSWLEIPGLNEQILRLEEEVNKLSSEVTRLSGQNDRYEDLNDDLNATVTDLQVINDSLNATTSRLEMINLNLTETREDFIERIDDLEEQNANYEELNTELNSTLGDLSTEIDRFHSTVGDLILENAELANLTDSLLNLTGSFELIGENQNSTIEALEVTLTSIVDENSRLETLNTDLTTIVTFLDETSIGLDNSLQQVTESLTNQINANQESVLSNVENTMRQRTAAWDCDYRIVFGDRTYGQDFTAEIPESEVDEVVNYVFNRILNALCLDRDDFALYLEQAQFTPLTSSRLATAVTLYTQSAIDWYFPEEGEAGLTYDNWAAAGYECQNLQPNEEYRFNV